MVIQTDDLNVIHALWPPHFCWGGFINQVVMHLEKNGTIEASLLFETPFTNVNNQRLPGVFDDAASTKIIQLIERVNGNASVG